MKNLESDSTLHAKDFWEDVHSDNKLQIVNSTHLGDISPSMQAAFLELLGDLEGKEVLELGCGDGLISVFLAKQGAKVTGIDFSENSISHTLRQAEYNQVEHLVEAKNMNALDIGDFENKFDLVIGKFILHHIEPFEQFSRSLANALKDSGKAVFIENSSRNPILILARTHLVGRYGIPKNGDDEEFPLEPKEVELLKKNVGRIHIHYPDFVLFRMINTYIFKWQPKYSFILDLMTKLDSLIQGRLPILHQYSYYQLVEVTKCAQSESSK